MKISRILLILSSLMLGLLFFFPLWRITLYAPQYLEGINMYIWINQITGDTPGTLQNINILNHYVGMKKIEPDSIPELTYFPYVVMALMVIGLGISITYKKTLYLFWPSLVALLGALGIYDFYLWEYDYGHNLSDTAPIKVPGMVYQPPLLGTKELLNFTAESYPHWGGLFLGLAILMGLVAYWKHEEGAKSISN